MKFEIELTNEEVQAALFSRRSPDFFEMKLFLSEKHFVDILSKFLERIELLERIESKKGLKK